MGREDQNLAAVRRLCEGWAKLSREEFRALMTPDCYYLNVPFPTRPRTGPDEAFETLKPYQDQAWRVDLKLLHIAAAGDVVLTERLETFFKPGQTKGIGLYVMGAFEMKDGKIAKWRDYFDAAQAAPIAPTASSAS